MFQPKCYLLSLFVITWLFSWVPVKQATAQANPGLQYLQAIENTYAKIIKENEKSVVAISVHKRLIGSKSLLQSEFGRKDVWGRIIVSPTDPQSPKFIPSQYGTGVVIDASGLILTNNHVLEDDSGQFKIDYYVTTSDRIVYRAEKISGNSRIDLAVLKLKTKQNVKINLRPITFGKAAKIRKGQLTLSLGNPYAIARDGQASACRGMIANLSRKAASENRNSLYHYGMLIQVDAKLNLGTSGSPLFNLQGEMIGLSTSIAAIVGYEKAAGYSIPVNDTFLRAVKELKQGKEVEFGLLGVEPDDIAPDDRRLGKRGMRINHVVRGTPADHVGLRAKDVVTHVNGEAINDGDELTLRIGKLPPASKVSLTVVRNERVIKVMPTLIKYKIKGNQTITNQRPSWRGLRVDYPSAVLELGTGIFSIPNNCVCVSEVEKDSPSWKAGLRKGMLISRVSGTPVSTPADFRRAIRRSKSRTVLHQLIRQPRSQDTEKAVIVEKK